MTADEIIAHLGLQPHPAEGGFFVETHRSAETLPAEALPARYGRPRSISTAIYYLLKPGTWSALHRLKSEEVFHFYLGDPVEMLQLHPDGRGETIVLGTNLRLGQRPQVLVPTGTWQGSRLVAGGSVALLGCTVAPGFDYQDYEHGNPADLRRQYPAFQKQIEALAS